MRFFELTVNDKIAGLHEEPRNQGATIVCTFAIVLILMALLRPLIRKRAGAAQANA